MPGLFQTKGTDLASIAAAACYERSGERTEREFLEIYGGEFRSFSEGKESGYTQVERDTADLLHADYMHAREDCGLTNSEFTRASTMVGLARGLMMSKGYKMSEILAGKVPDEEKKQIGREVLESFYSPKACGKMLAKAMKAYSDFDISQEIPLATGKTCSSKDDLRAAVSTPEGKIQTAGVIESFYNGAQELRQTLIFLSGNKLGSDFVIDEHRSNETYASYAAEMTEDDMIRKTRVGALCSTVKTCRFDSLSRAVVEASYTQQQLQDMHIGVGKQILGDQLTATVAELDETLEQHISQGKSLGDTKSYMGLALSRAAAGYVANSKAPKDLQAIESVMSGFGKERDKVLGDRLPAEQRAQIKAGVIPDASFSRLDRARKEKMFDAFTMDTEIGSKEDKAFREEFLRPEVLFESRDLRKTAYDQKKSAIEDINMRLKSVGLSGVQKDTLTAMRNDFERKTKYLGITLRQPPKEETKVEDFTLDAQFSDAFKDAFLKAADSKYMHDAKSEFQQQNPGVFAGMDDRDFLDLKLLTGYPDKDRKDAAKTYLQDYFSGDPAKREKCLDMFYDMYDAIDPTKLDLSCLTHKDKPTGPDMTDSEKDLLTFMEAWKFDQGSEVKMKENPSYLTKRYPSTEDQIRFRAKQDLMGGYAPFIASTFSRNELDPSGRRVPKEVADAMKTQRDYSENLVSISTAQYKAQMQLLDGDKEKGGVDLSKNIDSDFQIRVKDETMQFYDAFGVLAGANAVKEREALGLSELDMIYIDGKSAKEKYTGMSERDIKNQVMGDLCSGEHRVEIASLLKEKDGTFRVNVSSVKPNLHALDEIDKGQRSAARRFFDFGATKIETRADKSDKLWAKDPEGKDRKEGIRADLGSKILTKVSEKKKAEFEAQAEAAASEKTADATKVEMSLDELAGKNAKGMTGHEKRVALQEKAAEASPLTLQVPPAQKEAKTEEAPSLPVPPAKGQGMASKK